MSLKVHFKKTEAVAEKREETAKHLEKAEGKSDLVKDAVEVKTNVKGRDTDLSEQVVTEIGVTKDGATPVKIEAKVPPE